MGDNAPAEKTPGSAPIESVITTAVASARSEPIPNEQLNQILSSESYMKKLQPLIADAVKHASYITGLRGAITR